MIIYDPNPVGTFAKAIQSATDEELVELAQKYKVPVKRQFVSYVTVFGTKVNDLIDALEAVIIQNHLDRSTVSINGERERIQILGEAFYNLSNEVEAKIFKQKIISAYQASV